MICDEFIMRSQAYSKEKASEKKHGDYTNALFWVSFSGFTIKHIWICICCLKHLKKVTIFACSDRFYNCIYEEDNVRVWLLLHKCYRLKGQSPPPSSEPLELFICRLWRCFHFLLYIGCLDAYFMSPLLIVPRESGFISDSSFTPHRTWQWA